MASKSLLLGLLASDVLWLSAGNLLAHCNNEYPATNANTNQEGINAIMSSAAKEGYCRELGGEDNDKKKEFDTMMDMCDAFCAPEGIPILIGTTSTGFTQKELDGFVFAGNVTKSDQEQVRQCETDSRSIYKIQESVAQFVAAVEAFALQQQVFKARTVDKTEDLQKAMADPETTADRVRNFVGDQKMTEWIQIVKEERSALNNALDKEELADKMTSLTTRADQLKEVLKENVPGVIAFANDCNELFLGVGSDKAYLLDICATSGRVCLDHEQASHVGCVCGIIPAAGVFEVSGDPGRRLDDIPPDDGPTQNVDVCGRAFQLSADDRALALQKIKGTRTGTTILADAQKAERVKYPEYFKGCGARRLQAGKEGKREDSNMTDARRMSFSDCTEPGDTQAEGLKVVFDSMTNKDYCKNIYKSEQEIIDKCSSFCAPTGVAFTLGTMEFGFNREAMDQLCLKPNPDDEEEFQQKFVNECHAQAASFRQVQDKTSILVAKLIALETAQTYAKAVAVKANAELRKEIRDNAETKVDAAASSNAKINALQKLTLNALNDLMGGEETSAKTRLKKAAEEVGEAGKLLQEYLDNVVQGIQNAVSKCNTLVTGRGPLDEYLLDMCAVTSVDACMDTENGKHLGCCCGYNPMTAFGSADMSAETTTVNGLPGLGLPSSSFRRLTEDDSAYIICAEAEKEIELSSKYLKQSDFDRLGTDSYIIWEVAIENKQKEHSDYYDQRCDHGDAGDDGQDQSAGGGQDTSRSDRKSSKDVTFGVAVFWLAMSWLGSES